MTLALSTRYLGRRPFSASSLLSMMRKVGVRDCGLSDAVPQPAADELVSLLQPAGSRVVAVETRFAIEKDGDAAPSLLAANRETVGAARRAILRAAAMAKAVRSPIVVLHLGEHALERGKDRDAELRGRLTAHGVDAETERLGKALAHDIEKRLEPDLERACRNLFDLCVAEPEIRFAIATPDSFAGFPNLRALGLLLDELKGRGVGYWHDAGVARLHEKAGLAAKDQFAGDHASRIVGVSLHDIAGVDTHLPPGSGEIDFKALRDVLPSRVPFVMEVDSRFAPREVELAAELLRSAGY